MMSNKRIDTTYIQQLKKELCMKKVWLLFVVGGMLTMTSAFSQPQESHGRRHGKLMEELKLTDAQNAQFDKTRYETQKKQIELRAKIAIARLDLEKLMT